MTAPCHHCGAPTADVPLTATLEGAPRPVCSSACQGTAEWIDAQGLSDYYRLRRGPSHKPDAGSALGAPCVASAFGQTQRSVPVSRWGSLWWVRLAD